MPDETPAPAHMPQVTKELAQELFEEMVADGACRWPERDWDALSDAQKLFMRRLVYGHKPLPGYPVP